MFWIMNGGKKMFKIHEIRELIKLIDQSNIEEFKLDHEGSKLTLRKQSKGQVVTTVPVNQVPTAPITPQAVPVNVTATTEIAKQNDSMETKQDKEDETDLYKIKSPMVGTFYAASSPEAESYVKVGDSVSENSIVCIVEAMKLFNEIEAEVKGEIVDILVENGQLVEYGQPLFLVKQK